MSCSGTSNIQPFNGVDCRLRPACPGKDGCPQGVCPDFVIRRHDTLPPFKVQVSDCDGPIDLTGLVLEANMWALAKLKTAIDDVQTDIQFADGIGFEQCLPGDVVIAQRVRGPEKMLIVGFDETNSVVEVQRGYDGTTPSAWKKGTQLRVFRFINSTAVTEMVLGDDDNDEYDDGVHNRRAAYIPPLPEPVLEDPIQAMLPAPEEADPEFDSPASLPHYTQNATVEPREPIAESYLIYEWQPNDTCVPGCFWLEFKLMKVNPVQPPVSSTEPASDVCSLGAGVQWSRRFPVQGEGFLIKIVNSPTAEVVA